MIVNTKLMFICANAKEKKDGGKYCTCTFMSNNETQQFPLTEDCYNYILRQKVAPLQELTVAIDLGSFNGEKTYRVLGVAV